MSKRIITVTLTSIVMLLLFLAAHMLLSSGQLSTIKAGFIYVGDGATAYTVNYMQAQEAIEEQFGDRVECIAKYNVSEGHEEPYIHELINEGCNVIFGTSYGYEENMKKIAASYPKIQFCMATGDNAAEEPVLENYHTYMGHIYEGRYVTGVVAGMKLRDLIESGAIKSEDALVGYVAAYPYPEVISGYTAFFLGVRSACPEARMYVRYTDTWNGYVIEKNYAEDLIEHGCVVISQHSDTAGPAVACENANVGHPVYHVGYNQSMLDYAPTSSLISCRINWSQYEVAAVGALLDGSDIESSLPGSVVINGNDAGAGFDSGWIETLELNEIIAATGTRAKIESIIDGFRNHSINVFQGDYVGVNPLDPTDTIDLKDGYEENRTSSAPTFRYVLDDVITVLE